jgi:flagellar biosynthesis protein FlhB
MSDQNAGGQERTESPTPRRRARARDEGQIPRSTELTTSFTLLAGAFVLAGVAGHTLARYAIRLSQECARWISRGPMETAGAVTILDNATRGLLIALLPFLLTVGAAALAVNLLQTKGLITGKPLTPKWSNIDPLAGFRRLWSPEAAFTLVKSAAKLAALGLIGYLVVKGSWAIVSSLTEAGPAEISGALRSLLVRLALWVGLSFLAISVIDFWFRWSRLEKSLRMTRQEVIYEFRESEGDPIVKNRIRTLARTMMRRRMLQGVPKADVVIVNPTHIAVALRYDTSVAPAPIVVALGQRKLAQRIREIAAKAQVPIIENRAVARTLLATGKVGKPIPPRLYAVVAEILAFVYRQRAAAAAVMQPGLRRAA